MKEMRWRDASVGRSVLLREGLLAGAAGALAAEGWTEFELVTSERALGSAPGLAEAASRTHLVAAGQVPEVSAAILPDVGSERLVAFGGGRVIDAAKAVAAVKGGEVAAIPTTLSGAEMTAIHRMPAAAEGRGGVRPALVLADPEAMESLPEQRLRATAMNALAHGADSLYTPRADELSRSSALRGASLIADALDAGQERREPGMLSLGAILCGAAIDSAGLAIHHVISQSLVRVCETPHAETNAAVLPVVMDAMRERAPERIGALAAAIGCEPEAIRTRIEELAGGRRSLSEIGAERACLDPAVDTAFARPDLQGSTPGDVSRADLAAIVNAAW